MGRITRLVFAGCCAIVLATSAFARSLTEAPRNIEQLPHNVVRTMQHESAGAQVKQIEEILYHGLPVLYEFELDSGGTKWDLSIRPDGTLGDDAPDDDDDHADDEEEALEIQTDELAVRAIDLTSLPKNVSQSLATALKKNALRGAAEVRYETQIVVYQFDLTPIENGDEDADEADEDNEDDASRRLYIYPNGAKAWQNAELIERDLTLDELPASIATAFRAWLSGANADEIEEIRYEGIPIIYEAEITIDGAERELMLLGNGAIAPHVENNEGHDGIEEHDTDPGELPQLIADALERLIGGPVTEADIIYYEGVLVLYDGENDEFEASVYPDGTTAALHRDNGDDDGDDDEADENDDD